MEKNSIIPQIKEKFGNKIINLFEKNKLRYYIEIAPNDVVECAKILFSDLGLRFVISTGIDTEPCFEVLHHFSYDKTGEMVTLKIKLFDKKNPEIDSIAKVVVGAEWIEREMWELVGIKFKGHPDLRHLVLPNDWPEGKYPLRQK